MRRGATTIILVVVVVAVIFGAWIVGYNKGAAAGRTAVTADRSAFARATGGTGTTGGAAAGGGGFAGGGGGGAAAGGGGGGAAGGGTTASQGGLTGRATNVDANGTITLQQTNNTTVTVNASVTTAVQKFASGAVKDLHLGDFVAVQGDRGSDNTFAARMVTSISGPLPAGLIPSGGGNAAAGGGNAAAGGGATGGQGARGQAAGSAAAGSTPGAAGRGGQGTGAAGGNASGGFLSGGTFGRLMRIDGTTLTVQGFDGANLTVKTDTNTAIRTSLPGTVSDIKPGDMLIVQADPAGTGIYNARIILDQGTTGG